MMEKIVKLSDHATKINDVVSAVNVESLFAACYNIQPKKKSNTKK